MININRVQKIPINKGFLTPQVILAISLILERYILLSNQDKFRVKMVFLSS